MILPDNFSMSLKRLKTLVQRLKSYKTDILKEYHSVICEQLEQGIVEHVDVAELKEPGTVHYLPHREVLRTDRTTIKLKVVYDSSSKQPAELSLNDVLCAGPNLLPHLFDLLLRFRLHKVALTADTEHAFLNISVNPNERDFLRFLWFNSIESDDPEIVVLIFTRLVFGLISSPFALGATVRHHLSKYENFDKESVAEVIRSLYVDDFVDDFASGSHSVDSAFVLYQKLKKVFSEGNFNMRKWLLNDPELMNLIEKAETKTVTVGQSEPKLSEDSSGVVNEDLTYSKIMLNGLNSGDDVKVLGIAWDRKSDSLKFDLTKVVEDVNFDHVTIRTILSSAAKFYDSLGIISPIILPLKLLFQVVCKLTDVEWDSELESTIVGRFKEIIEDICATGTIEVKRCCYEDLNNATSVQIHAFSDAS